MVLTPKQKEELNKAIADYLHTSGFQSALEAFKNEADIKGDMEKKICRSSGKEMDLSNTTSEEGNGIRNEIE